MGARTVYFVLSVFGLVLSIYAVYIENLKLKDENYTALCDIDETISCSAVLTSEYSVGLGLIEEYLGKDNILNIPNAYYGVLLYLIQIALGLMSSRIVIHLRLFVSSISMLASLFLMYVLFFIMYKACLVCLATHVVNTGLLICSILMYWKTSKPKVA